MTGEERLLRAVRADRDRSLWEEAVRILTAAGMEDEEDRWLYARAAQRIRDRLRGERKVGA